MKEDIHLYPYRRHLKTCPYFGPGGRASRLDKCRCPFHADGSYRGQRVRQSLKTRSRQIADRNLAALLQRLDANLSKQPPTVKPEESAPVIIAIAGPIQHTVSDAVGRFLKARGDIERATLRKYRTSLRFLASFCAERRLSNLAEVTTDALEDFHGSRKIKPLTWKVERQTLVTFFDYCLSRKWITTNPAKELKPPRNLKPNEVVPYSPEEECRILAACVQIGGSKYHRSGARYEQLRARAMVMLLRHTALRISDVCTLRKDTLSWDETKHTWRVLLRTQKTGEPVFLPIPEGLKLVLDALPLPRSAAPDCPYYFWNGQTSRRAVVGIAERTLSAVFKKSGVKNAHAHRYRHTLATRLLAQGATFEQVADILGNSPAVVRKHYGKWSKGRQDNIDRLMFEHFLTEATTNPVTKKSHENLGPVN